jgi:FkbM family methyltransferase
MPRPCLLYPEPHDPPRPGCPVCQLDTPGHPRFSPAHHAHWNGLPTPAAARAEAPAACRSFGRAVPGPERQALGLAHNKDWHECTHPSRPLGKHVCPCQVCGPNCSGYISEDADAEFVEALRAAVAAAKATPFPEGRYAGRGIVIPAGGWKLFPGAYVTARFLRWDHINCGLPIEVWCIGDEGEYDHTFHLLTKGMGVTWRNASEELRRRGIVLPERLRGWALKLLLPLLSDFEQQIILDADCYPIDDPERLWDHPAIKDKSAAFWPDLQSNKWGMPLSSEQWAIFGLPTPREPIQPFESGQMLIDVRKSWNAVQVAAWLAGWMSKFDATRGAHPGVHGDKEAFSVAWRATETPYHMAPPVRWNEVAFIQHDPDGRPAFIHRCQDKPRIDFAEFTTKQKHAHGQFRSTTLHHEHYWHHCLRELRDTLRPPLPGFRDGTQDVQVWNEVALGNVYQLPERVDGWRIIDVGSHIGIFALQALKRGAAHVLCVEPWRPNGNLSRLNLAGWGGRVLLREAAVAAPGVKSVRMRASTTDPSLTAEPHVAPEGVDVPAVGLDELILQSAAGGRVDLLKIDAEGGEYPAILTATRLDLVDRIACEWHSAVPAGTPADLRAALEATGFAVELTGEGLGIGMLFAARPTTAE